MTEEQQPEPAAPPPAEQGELFSVRIACWKKGQGRAEEAADPAECGGAALSWVHFIARDKEASAAYLIDQLGFHELEVEDSLTEGERPHLHENEDHLFFTAPAIRVHGFKLYFTEVGFFVRKSQLVTVATEPVPLLEDWLDRACSKGGIRVPDAPRLMYLLIDAIVDAYYPAMDKLEDRAEELEGHVFGGQVVPIKDLLRLKRRLLEVRRRLSPFRDILNGLLRLGIPLISRADRIYFQDVYDHVLRILEHADLSRDILASVLDANLATVSNRLNQIMRAMTVIATVLMSVAVITGVYGMNFKFMPELNSPWGYPFALLLMLLVALFELWLFRKKGWL